jgi:predicted GNAT superfamily acetyltransferase
VGVKSAKGGYELIVHEIFRDKPTRKARIYATCAFRFKDSGQRIAFGGEAVITGENG